MTEEWQRLALWVARPYADHRDAEDIRQEALVGAWLGMQRVAAKGIGCTPRQAAVKGARWAVADYLRRGKRVKEQPPPVWSLDQLIEGWDTHSTGYTGDKLEPRTDGGINAADARLQLWLHYQQPQVRQPLRTCRTCGCSVDHLNRRARYCTPACKYRACDAKRPSGPLRARQRAEKEKSRESA